MSRSRKAMEALGATSVPHSEREKGGEAVAGLDRSAAWEVMTNEGPIVM